jgi:Arc/MetJ-type ribon-helix-helix transcriptional regulator
MGQQINTVFHNGLINDMDEFVGDDKPYASHQDLIRDAVRDKLRTLKVDA